MEEKNPTPVWKHPQIFETTDQEVSTPKQPNTYDKKTIFKHVALFLITFAMVSLAGASFVGFNPTLFPIALPGIEDFWRGALFAGLLLGFLATHEFGHFFAAIHHKIKVSLPYFIPIPLGIGTMGAVIRIRQKIHNSRKMFDVGAAGPLAGFVVSIAVLLIGFATLPDPSYINQFAGHEAVKEFVNNYGYFPEMPPGESTGQTLIVGETLLYTLLAGFFENVPPMWEMYHYPFLFAGWLGLFFTALNLMPVGQLDGGHILYSLIGFEKQKLVARIAFGLLTILAGIEFIPFVHIFLGEWSHPTGFYSLVIWAGILFLLLRKGYHNEHTWIAPVLVISLISSAAYLFFQVDSLGSANSSLIWIVWCFFIAYFVGIEHPPVLNEEKLDPTRRFLGWLCMIIFVLCISPNPLYFI
ncbi:MAG: site-2 protease family protein [Balneolaceae bacterium]|nr:site-2 protease family protein [Balneolaceae bacterium]